MESARRVVGILVMGDKTLITTDNNCFDCRRQQFERESSLYDLPQHPKAP